MSDRPVLSGTLRGYAEAWRKLRAEGHPGGVQPEDLLAWADQVAVLEQGIDQIVEEMRGATMTALSDEDRVDQWADQLSALRKSDG